jgi:hypothetical protein
VRWSAAKVLRGGKAIWLVPARRTAERLDALAAAGWTRKAVVAATGVSRATLQRIRREGLPHAGRPQINP